MYTLNIYNVICQLYLNRLRIQHWLPIKEENIALNILALKKKSSTNKQIHKEHIMVWEIYNLYIHDFVIKKSYYFENYEENIFHLKVFVRSCLTLWDPMDCSTPGFSVLHYLPEFDQTHVHWVNDAIQPSHPLSSSSSPALNLSQNQGLFQLVGFSHQVAKVLELQLQHHYLQWILRVDFL